MESAPLRQRGLEFAPLRQRGLEFAPLWQRGVRGDLEYLRKRGQPIERVDALRGLGVQVELAVLEIWADERVAALDVAVEIGQHALVKQLHLTVQRFAGLAFQYFK